MCLKQVKADFWAIHIFKKEKRYYFGTNNEWLMGCNRKKEKQGLHFRKPFLTIKTA